MSYWNIGDSFSMGSDTYQITAIDYASDRVFAKDGTGATGFVFNSSQMSMYTRVKLGAQTAYNEPRCQCGADITWPDESEYLHSDYCPKYKKP